jgi:hypothetical protein
VEIQHVAFAVLCFYGTAAWQRCPAGTRPEYVCSFQNPRIVQNNNTIRIGKQIIDMPPHPAEKTFARATVTVPHLLKGEKGFSTTDSASRLRRRPCLTQRRLSDTRSVSSNPS